MKLTLAVNETDYDPGAERMRVAGTNKTETQWVKRGQFHTFELQPFVEFTVSKAHWDPVTLARIDAACDAGRGAKTACIVMEEGLAHICLVSSSLTLLKAKVEKSIPRKSALSASKRSTAMDKFMMGVYTAMVNAIDLEEVQSVIIGSPGFLREDFLKFLLAQASKDGEKGWGSARSRILLESTSSGLMSAVSELLALPGVRRHLGDSQAAADSAHLDKFLGMLRTDPDRACYGPKEIARAVGNGAVELLLISDGVFRSDSLKERERAVQLTEAVKAGSGEVRVFSSEHPAGQQIAQLGGVAAVLRFAMMEDEEEFEVEESPAAAGGDGSDWATGDEFPF